MYLTHGKQKQGKRYHQRNRKSYGISPNNIKKFNESQLIKLML
jgi:hypothetical protein